MESINAILRVKWLQKKCIIFRTLSPCNVNYIQNIHRCDWKQFVRILRFSSEKKRSNINRINERYYSMFSMEFRSVSSSVEREDFPRRRNDSEDNFQKGTLSSQSMLITRPGWQTRTSLKFLWANVWARRRFRPPGRFQKTDTKWSMRAPLRWRLIEILINARCLLVALRGG